MNIIQLSGGDAPPAPYQPVRTPDSLSSKQTLLMLFAINDGEISQLTDITFNDTSISNYSADFAYTKGTVDQAAIVGFDSVAAVKAGVSQELLQNNAVDITINKDASHVRVVIVLPSGLQYNGSNGDNLESSVTLQIWTNPTDVGGTFTLINTITRKGKSSVSYSFDVLVDNPNPSDRINPMVGTTPWRVRIIRTSAPSITSGFGHVNATSLQSVVEYTSADGGTYAGTSLLAVRITDASEVGNSVPTVGGKGKGSLLVVPSNSYYNASARTYTANMTWDGTFNSTRVFSRNLSWIIANILSELVPTTSSLYEGLVGYESRIPIAGRNIIAFTASTSTVTSSTPYVNGNTIRFNSIVTTTGISTATTYYVINAVGNDFKISATSGGSAIAFTGNGTGSTEVPFKQVNRTLGIPAEYMAIYTFDRFARYCDETLSTSSTTNGVTTTVTEPRYSLDSQFVERLDAETALNQILSIGNASLIEVNGLVSVTWDYKLSTTEIGLLPFITNQNIDGGMFEYTNSHIAENYTQINITIQDKTNLNRTKTVIISSDELAEFLYLTNPTKYAHLADNQYYVKRYGYNVLDIKLVGVTSDLCALRKGRSLLFDVLENDEVVTFKSLVEGAALYKGKCIRVADEDNHTVITNGRVLSSSWNNTTKIMTVVLDREIAISTVTNVTLYYNNTVAVEESLRPSETHYLPSPITEVPLEVTNGVTGLISTITFYLPAWTGELIRNDSIFVARADLMSMYKVITTSIDENGYTIAAMKYQTIKFDYIESSYISKTKRLTQLVQQRVNAPVVFTTADITIDSPFFYGRTSVVYLVKWTHTPYITSNALPFLPTYFITCTFPNGTSTVTSASGFSPDSTGVIRGETRITVPSLQIVYGVLATYTAELTFTIVATSTAMDNSKPVSVIHTQGVLEGLKIQSTIFEGR